HTMTLSEGYWKAPYLTLICVRYLREASFWLSPTAKQESIKLIELLLPWMSFRLIGAKRLRLGVWAIRRSDDPCIFFRLLSLIKNGVVRFAFSLSEIKQDKLSMTRIFAPDLNAWFSISLTKKASYSSIASS